MRYIVLDTNCLLQMISRHSPYYAIWQSFQLGRYYLCVSNDIISEYREIIGRIANSLVAEGVTEAIMNSPYCLRYDPHFHFNLIQQDPDDNKFVDCAIISNADYIVSDDSHFRVLRSIPYPRVKVVSLNQFFKDMK